MGTFAITSLSLIDIELSFNKFGKHPAELIGMVYKGIPGPEELPGFIIDQFDLFLFKFLHCPGQVIHLVGYQEETLPLAFDVFGHFPVRRR